MPEDVPVGVKAIRELVSRPGLFKMRPFELEAEYYYDEQGRLIKQFTHHIDQSMWGRTVASSHQEYAYNDQGKLKEHYREGYDGYFSSLTGYEYDTEGRLLEIIQYNPDRTIKKRQPVAKPSGQQVPEISANENKITFDTLQSGYMASIASPTGNVLTERRVLLNDKQQVAHIITTNTKQQTVSIINYKYDFEGKEIEQEFLDGKGRIIMKYRNTYSVSGFLMKKTMSGPRDKIQKVIKYEYEFY